RASAAMGLDRGIFPGARRRMLRRLPDCAGLAPSKPGPQHTRRVSPRYRPSSPSSVPNPIACAADRASHGHPKKYFAALSATMIPERILDGMERPTLTAPSLIVAEEPSRDVAAALVRLSNADVVRLNALARLWTRGMPETLSWADVLQEAIARA